ncbi:MAG: transcriptional repressor [Methylococcales bacterium]|nr:transcriptional repressor [Methylococcales bacterium]
MTDALFSQHNHQRCITQALNSAEKICQQKNIRLTPIRKHIFELIWLNHKAVGAYDLLETLQLKDPKAKPVTIYRALDFLLESGLVHKIESLNAFVGCLQPEFEHQSILLICDQCHQADEVEAQPIFEGIYKIAEQNVFTPKNISLELHGICHVCRL